MNAAGPPGAVQMAHGENVLNILSLPPKSRSPNQAPNRRLSAVVHATNDARRGSHTKNASNASGLHDRALQEIQPSQLSEWKELPLDAQQESFSPRFCMWCLMYLLDYVSLQNPVISSCN
jgi:hypothetical protein